MTSLTESSTDTTQDTQNAATAVSENLIEHPRGAEPGKPDAEQSAAHLRGAWYFDPGSAQTFRRGENPDPPGGAAVI